ncbi:MULTISPECIES: hypothetical protein [Pseudomonas]|uniref:hypothetical protein n=1 Tax=Pseudomonas TaxID=286 RepID=UPI00126037E6|nr:MULTISPECIES: hypothetical protein [Pseudomonas]
MATGLGDRASGEVCIQIPFIKDHSSKTYTGGDDGFAALKVEQKIIDTQKRPKGQACEKISAKPALPSVTLTFDGSQYPVPKALSYP